MFTIVVEYILTIIRIINSICLKLISGSYYIGFIICNTIYGACGILADIQSALIVIGEEFYDFLRNLKEDTVEVINYIQSAISAVVNWFIEGPTLFCECMKAFFSNTQLYFDLLVTKIGEFFIGLCTELQNSIIFICEYFLNGITLINKQLAEAMVDFGDSIANSITNSIIVIGDLTSPFMSMILLTLTSTMDYVMFLIAVVLIVLFLYMCWCNRQAIYFFIQDIYDCCRGKLIRTFITCSIVIEYKYYGIPDYLRCVVCQDQVKCVVLLPCKHLCLCKDCRNTLLVYQQHNKCPVCRSQVDNYYSVYI